MILTLNVGCGSDFGGDIRLDKKKTEAANILADAQFLPFKSSVFDFVFCISVLEHIPSWSQALREILRVARGRVILEVPVNSDLRKTDVFRLLIPTLSNIWLFLKLPQRARETLWQMDPGILGKFIYDHGFDGTVAQIFQFYAGMPSRCWRIYAWRKQDA